ncbi:MAG: maleate cis-trans isomerase [Actinomycetota bacterium]|nr:maleate cis-trans isomerase [Actinomycetota bacterium]
MKTVGFLYPGYAAESDYPLAARLLSGGAALPVVHTSVGEDAHRVDALLDLGSPDRLAEGLTAFGQAGVDAVVWACTSGSFVFGWAGALAQVHLLAEQYGVPATSTSFAFVSAAQTIGARRVAVAATYPQDVAESFARFLAAGGIEVLSLSSRGIITASEVGTLGRDQVIDLALTNDRPDADAVLLPDTALHTVAWIEDLESRLGKPVLTANQVSVWDGLRHAGHTQRCAGLGALFRSASTPLAGIPPVAHGGGR